MKPDLPHLDPVRTVRDGRPVWLWPNGKVLPVVAGGEGPTPPAPAPAPAPPAPTDPPAPPAPPDPPAPSAEPGFPENTPLVEMTPAQQAAYWKDKARKHETRANQRADYDDLKAKADQYDALANASKTEQERAIEAARTETADQIRAEERAKTGVRLVDAEMRAAAAGRLTSEQLGVILDPIDRTKFLTADGDVDTEKVVAFVAGIAPAPEGGNGRRFPDLGQGRRGDGQGSTATPSVQSGRDRYKARHGRTTTTTT